MKVQYLFISRLVISCAYRAMRVSKGAKVHLVMKVQRYIQCVNLLLKFLQC